MTTTLLDHLVRMFPAAKRQTLKRMVQAGRVTIGGRRARTLKDPVGESESVVVADRAAATASAPKLAAPPFRVIHEDADILVVDKPPGLLTSTVPREPRPTLLAAVRAYVTAREPRARAGLIHRLDRDASGLLIFSKSDRAYGSLKTQFFRHAVRREYAAVVRGAPTPAAGRIESWLVERADGTVRSTQQHAAGRRAITDYETIRKGGGNSLLRVTLLTGRKHQIRVQLSERGCPILNDPLYGGGEIQTPGGLLLAATRLTVVHPATSAEITFTLALPDELESALTPP